MRLYVIRHADAESRSISDAARHLSAKGHKQAEALGRYMSAQGLVPELIISSPLVRAVETSTDISGQLGGTDIVQDDTLACGMSPEEACQVIGEYAQIESLALVGHNPDLSYLCAYLGNMNGEFQMKKAALAVFDLNGSGPVGAVLMALVPPKMVP